MSESSLFVQQAIALVNYYGFDLGQYTLRELMVKWSQNYCHPWLPLAVTEAIYQGKLKVISVEQILDLWTKKGRPARHFNSEFERLIDIQDRCWSQGEINIHSQSKSHNIDDSILFNNHKISGKSENNYNNSSKYSSSIQEFIPPEDRSLCFSKLKALAETNFPMAMLLDW